MWEFGGNFSITPELLHCFTPIDRPKRCKSGGFFVFYPLTLTPFYPRWEPNAAQKDVRVFSCIFIKKSSHCSPTLTLFWAEKFNSGCHPTPRPHPSTWRFRPLSRPTPPISSLLPMIASLRPSYILRKPTAWAVDWEPFVRRCFK